MKIMFNAPLIDRQIANFRVERIIQRGGMAQVYYGQDVKLQRPVAIKVIDTFYRSHALIWHVTVFASNTVAGVHALAPHFNLWMLRFQRVCLAVFVHPIFPTHFVVIGFDLLDFQAVLPRIRQQFFGALEVIFDVALCAHKRAHLLA